MSEIMKRQKLNTNVIQSTNMDETRRGREQVDAKAKTKQDVTKKIDRKRSKITETPAVMNGGKGKADRHRCGKT